jgi:probable rRNA maturation factor
MRLDITLATEDSIQPDAGFVQRVAEQALLRGVKEVEISTVFEVEIIFVSEARIREINHTYRAKDAVTDVLSFGDYADTGLPRPLVSEVPVLLGQLFVCYDYIVRAAEEDQVSLERELAYILSHGILHLLGYDHTEEMFAIQETISEQY